MDSLRLQHIVEGALLAAAAPLSIKRLGELFEEGEAPEKEAFEEALAAIAASCEDRGFELKEVASGWRLQVREELAPWINRLWEEKPQKYSRALLETLALIAYRQPITRGDIEEIRGVAVSSHIIKTLVERNWVKVVGHRDVPGRPSLYATTRSFLDYFNLKSLDELPSLSEIRDLDEINASLDLSLEESLSQTSGGDESDDNEESEVSAAEKHEDPATAANEDEAPSEDKTVDADAAPLAGSLAEEEEDESPSASGDEPPVSAADTDEYEAERKPADDSSVHQRNQEI